MAYILLGLVLVVPTATAMAMATSAAYTSGVKSLPKTSAAIILVHGYSDLWVSYTRVSNG